MAAVAVDRSRDCPVALRMFVSTAAHRPDAYAKGFPADATPVTTSIFKDSTLRDLACAVYAGVEAARSPGARLSFSVVYPNSSGAPVMKAAGIVAPLREGGPDDGKTAAALRIEAGDVMDVHLLPPLGGGGGAAPHPPPPGRRQR